MLPYVPRSAPDLILDPQVEQLRGDWAMVAVLDFFTTFRQAAGLRVRDFAAGDLERALVVSPGGPGLLADVHMVSL